VADVAGARATLKRPPLKSCLKTASSSEPSTRAPVRGALFPTPGCTVSALSPFQQLPHTGGPSSMGVHATILESSGLSPETLDGLSAEQSTPTRDSIPLSELQQCSTAGGGAVLTTCGRRQGTPAFGAVEGLEDDDGMDTGTDCSTTPVADCTACSSSLPVEKQCAHEDDAVHSSAGQLCGNVDSAACLAEVHSERVPHAESFGDHMMAGWLEQQTDTTIQAALGKGCAGGFGSPVGMEWNGFSVPMSRSGAGCVACSVCAR
jgi:hypothetical protein